MIQLLIVALSLISSGFMLYLFRLPSRAVERPPAIPRQLEPPLVTLDWEGLV